MKNDIDFNVIVEKVDIEERDGSKWAVLEGTALVTGLSSNKVNYRLKNLKENDGSEFSVLAGHRKDYDNPDHVVGDGKYSLKGEKLRFKAEVKNTHQHPDIVEKSKDKLLSVSVQGGYERIDFEKDDKGHVKNAIVEGLHIPILALVNKHTRGIQGATIESVIAERIELENKKTQEVDNMVEEKDVFAKQIAEKDKELAEANKKLEDMKEADTDVAKKLKEAEDKLKEVKEAKEKVELEEKTKLVDKLCEQNKELKKEELMEKSDSELKIIESYEDKAAEDAKVSKDGAGVLQQRDKDLNKANEDIKDDGIVFNRLGDLTMTEEAYKKFNQDVKERILGKE